MISIDLRLKDPRRAGRVRRYHTWPHIQEQSVAEHSWQVARIIRSVWPEASSRLIDYCLFHDLGEQVAGDPPYPVKRLNPEFAREHQVIESVAYQQIVDSWNLPSLTIAELEYHVFRTAHYIEMWEWALDEICLGNREASLVASRCSKGADLELSSITDPQIVESFRSYIIQRGVSQGDIVG